MRVHEALEAIRSGDGDEEAVRERVVSALERAEKASGEMMRLLDRMVREKHAH